MADQKLPRHRFWGAGEPDCPPELKAPNGELHTTRCKVCGDGWRKSGNVCLPLDGARGVKVRYDGLNEYAERNRLDYNELCRVVRGACGVTEVPTRFTDDELVRFYEQWLFNEEDPGEAEFIRLVREVERRVMARTPGVPGVDAHTFSHHTPTVGKDEQ
jgi:hypothetical protein